MTTLSDPQQSYALYLPSGYDPSPADHADRSQRKWPVLLVMDARGRALAAGRRFETAAEDHDWVIVSAYGTSSDSGWEPNQRALAAVLPDLEKRLAIDKRRLYLAGFSGTVRIGWVLGEKIPGVAGLIAASGGTPTFEPPETAPPFAVFATAGTRDFNHREVLLLTRALEELGTPHRLAVFDGVHQWMPEELAAEAVAWLDLRSMRDGLRPVDKDRVAEHLTARLAAARKAASPLAAHDAYAALLRDFDGWIDTPALEIARTEAARLAQDPAVRDGRKQQDRQLAEEARYQQQVQRVVGAYRASPLPGKPGQLSRDLDLEALGRQAQDSEGDPEAAASASRRLAMAYSQLSFYLPRELTADGSHAQAAQVLELAREIYDRNPRVSYELAVSRAHLGRADAALEALEAAVGQGYRDAATLRAESAFDVLRTDEALGPRFEELVASLGD